MEKITEKKLQGLLNKPWKYGMRVVVITGYDVSEERQRVFIHTNEKENHFDRPFDSIGDFVKQLVPAEKKETQSDIMVMSATNVSTQLKGILLDNIQKVQENKEYIPQATTICNNVNSLINLTKLELSYITAAKKFKEAES